MPVMARARKDRVSKGTAPRKEKVSKSSLHGHAVEVSVDERLERLVQRFPALRPSLASLLLQGKKRIRDLPVAEQERILRMVFALK